MRLYVLALRHNCYALMGRDSSKLCLLTSDQCFGIVHVCVFVLLSCLLLPPKCGVASFVLARVITMEIMCRFSSSE